MQQTQRTLLSASALAALVGLAFWGVSRRERGSETPLRITGADVPSILRAGDPNGAIERARQLYTVYRDAGFDAARVPFELATLPDQQYAEHEASRDPRQTAWAFPSRVPAYSDIAFYTTIYARENRSYYRHYSSRSKPEGFWIVVWKDGRIEEIPLMAIRLLPIQDRDFPGTSWLPIFPGMAGYDTARPLITDAG